jgi:hypothetical protein
MIDRIDRRQRQEGGEEEGGERERERDLVWFSGFVTIYENMAVVVCVWM